MQKLDVFSQGNSPYITIHFHSKLGEKDQITNLLPIESAVRKTVESKILEWIGDAVCRSFRCVAPHFVQQLRGAKAKGKGTLN